MTTSTNNIAELMQTLGIQARQAATHMATATAAQKNTALKTLAALLPQQRTALQAANAQDIAQASAAGLSAPMVDRLRLDDATLATLSEGCLQLAAMPDVIGRFDGYGVEGGGGSVDKFGAFMASEYKKWGDVVRAANITDES